MPLTDARIRSLKPSPKPRSVSDGRGLFVEVMPGGKSFFRMRYRLHGRQEKVSLGEYPAYSLSQAREWSHDCLRLISRGLSPMELRRGDVPQEAGEPSRLAQDFLGRWYGRYRGRYEAKRQEQHSGNQFATLADEWLEQVIRGRVKNTKNVERALRKDILPRIGTRQLSEITPDDVLAITDGIKRRGSEQMALQTHCYLRRILDYAISRQKLTVNPAHAIERRFIATARSRDIALTKEEIGGLMAGIYRSSLGRAQKLAVHLLMICMVRKSELIEARWEEIDLGKATWSIPPQRMKQGNPHIVPLSKQAVSMLEELRELSAGSEWVFPSRNDRRRPISKTTLNKAIQGLPLASRAFVLHDFRRSASTLLHEQGFQPDWIEKALAHHIKGVRGIYNRAEYLEDRRRMLQWLADGVDQWVRSHGNLSLSESAALGVLKPANKRGD